MYTKEEFPALTQGAKPIEQTERSLVFLGGIGYEQHRNSEVGSAILHTTGVVGDVITIPDEGHLVSGDSAIIVHQNGEHEEVPGKEVMRRLDEPAEARYSTLHQRRAEKLIAEIEAAGGSPVDAIFQSVDVSTGLLAMSQRPDLFNDVVLLDPSSIVKHPSIAKYAREEWKNGNLKEVITKRKGTEDIERFELKASIKEKRARSRNSARSGNRDASYYSFQAGMLHEIATSENAPRISIVASRYDHAYSPLAIVDSLVDLNDVDFMFVTNTRHGLGGKKQKLQEVVTALGATAGETDSFVQKLHFAPGISEEYMQKMVEAVRRKEATSAIDTVM